MIVQEMNLNLIPDSPPVIIRVDQYDTGEGRLVANLYDGPNLYKPDSGATAVVQGTKPDKKGFSYPATLDGSTVTADLTQQMSCVGGNVRCQFVITEPTGRTGTFVFVMKVQDSALADDTDISETVLPDIIDAAERNAERAEEAAKHYPYVDPTTKHWMEWDVETEQFVDTGISAEGNILEAGTGIDISSGIISVDADAQPTEDSVKPVTSGGVYTALETKQDKLTEGDHISIDAQTNTISATYDPATQSKDGLMSSEDKTKLDGIEAGAEVNVQADWDQSTTTADDFIKNKPTLGTAAAKNSTNAVTAGSTNLVESGAVKDAIDSAITSAYKEAGTKTCAELTSALLIAANRGNVYNITDDGTTTADFVEGAGHPIKAGDNVGVTLSGSVYKFDLLSGFVDVSGFQTKAISSTVEGQSTVEGALSALSTNKQPKTLSTPITVDGVQKTTVEATLSAINSLAADNKTNKQPKTLTTPITVDGTQQTTVEGAIGAVNTYAGKVDGEVDYVEHNMFAKDANDAPYVLRRGQGSLVDIKKIIGASIAWNQLVPNSGSSLSVTVTNGHKYIMKKSGTWSCSASDGTAITGLTGGSDMIIDLTAMFGSTIADYIYSLEQASAGSGIAWIKSYGFFSKDYYTYDAGSIQSVSVGSRKVVGKNLLEGRLSKTGITGTGEINYSPSLTYDIVYARIIKGMTYTVETGSTGADSFIAAFYSSVPQNGSVSYNGQRVVSNNHTFVAPITGYVAVRIDETYSTPQCEFGLVSTAFEPYTETQYPFDSSKQFRGLFKLSGNKLYAEGDIYPPSGEVARKYSIVDLGTLDWDRGLTNVSGKYRFNCSLDAKSSDLTNGVTSICSKYDILASGGTFLATVNGYTITADNNIIIYDESKSSLDVEAFKTAMSGVYLVYESVTPTTETADPYDLTQICYSDGTEEFVDALTRDVMVPVGNDSVYYLSGEDVRENLDAEKADNSDLASISITGTTNNTGSTIAAGTYFYLNGALVMAKTSIANGATLTANTNYEAVSNGGFNNLLGLLTFGRIANVASGTTKIDDILAGIWSATSSITAAFTDAPDLVTAGVSVIWTTKISASYDDYMTVLFNARVGKIYYRSRYGSTLTAWKEISGV